MFILCNACRQTIMIHCRHNVCINKWLFIWRWMLWAVILDYGLCRVHFFKSFFWGIAVSFLPLSKIQKQYRTIKALLFFSNEFQKNVGSRLQFKNIFFDMGVFFLTLSWELCRFVCLCFYRHLEGLGHDLSSKFKILFFQF